MSVDTAMQTQTKAAAIAATATSGDITEYTRLVRFYAKLLNQEQAEERIQQLYVTVHHLITSHTFRCLKIMAYWADHRELRHAFRYGLAAFGHDRGKRQVVLSGSNELRIMLHYEPATKDRQWEIIKAHVGRKHLIESTEAMGEDFLDLDPIHSVSAATHHMGLKKTDRSYGFFPELRVDDHPIGFMMPIVDIYEAMTSGSRLYAEYFDNARTHKKAMDEIKRLSIQGVLHPEYVEDFREFLTTCPEATMNLPLLLSKLQLSV